MAMRPTTAILVSRSANGGYTWDAPTTVILHTNGGDDKEAITADPNDARYVYAVWDRPASGGISVWFSRTADSGATWDAARVILSPANAFATANQLVVLPDGSVVDIFVWSTQQNTNSVPYVAAIRSTDHGLTWSTPVFASTNQTIGTVNANTQTGLRTGAGITSASVDRTSGAIYVVWSDARFSGGQRDGVALSKSVDGGLTWSKPVQVNQAPNVQAFTPTVAVAADGSVGVTYFDFREDTGAADTLLANYWRVVSKDGGATWQETAVDRSLRHPERAASRGCSVPRRLPGPGGVGRSVPVLLRGGQLGQHREPHQRLCRLHGPPREAAAPLFAPK